MAELSGRNRLFILVGVAVLALVLGFFFFKTGTGKQTPRVGSSAMVDKPPPVDPVSGVSQSAEYNNTVDRENQDRAAAAVAAGQTTIPVLSNPQPGSSGVFRDPQRPVTPTPLPPPKADPAPLPAPTLPGNRTSRPTAPPRLAEEQKRSVDALAKHIEAMRASWQPRQPYQEFQHVAEIPEEVVPPAAPSPSSSAGFAGDFAGENDLSSGQEKAPPMILAGSIVPAVLLGPINSDNPGPVLAQIVAGPLSGARVLGTFQLRRKNVVLEFSRISWPQAGRSLSISAYGVNEDASLGMASDVNNHYFLRYGLSLAAAFIEGYGTAAGRGNTTVIIGPTGLPIEQRGELTSEQIRQSALADVGQELGSQLESASNIPPTIKVDAQTPIGLLFMADF